MTNEAPRSLRARGQILPIVGVTLVVLMTLANAAANLIPMHRPSAAALRAEDQRVVIEQRQLRIAELRLAGDHCWPATAHELARLLVMDGQWANAHAYADGYERRCGEDPVVHHWGNAPVPHAR